MDKTIGIIIPVYNSSQTIGRLVDKLIQTLPYKNKKIVLVNDGSHDDSHKVCLEKANRYKDIVIYLSLSRNFGEHNAVMAGLNYVNADYVVILDDDFQNPPGEVEKLVNTAITGGYDVTYTYYNKKKHSLYRNIGSRINDFFATLLIKKPSDLYLSSFKCMNRFIVNEVIKYKGPFPYIDGLILRATMNIGRVLVEHRERQFSQSNYTFKKLVHLWLNMFVNFSVMPLRASALVGLLMLSFGFLSSAYIIIEKIFFSSAPLGWASLMFAIITFSGVQLFMLGLVGEYLGRLFMTENKTPQYVVNNVWNLKNHE